MYNRLVSGRFLLTLVLAAIAVGLQFGLPTWLCFVGRETTAFLAAQQLDQADDVSPTLFVQLAHYGAVDAIALSRDGRWLATHGGRDMTARIWDVASGRQLRQIGGIQPFHHIAF